MHYYKEAELNAETQENEAIFIVRVFRICNDASVVVKERGFGLLKGYAVFPPVLRSLPRAPFEREFRYTYIVTTR